MWEAGQVNGLVEDEDARRCGFVVLVGRPNVGKSTILNMLIGAKVAIVSDKPQTTRSRILGVLTRNDVQVVFVDTPGIHRPKHRLGESMVAAAKRALADVDMVVFVADAGAGMGGGDRFIMEMLRGVSRPVVLALNKVDLVAPEAIGDLISRYRQIYGFAAAVPVAALHGRGLDRLLEEIMVRLPRGPFLYPADTLTDRPERFIVAELIREKVLELTREEIPHAVAVEMEEMEKRESGVVYIRAAIYAERDSHKMILVGKEASMLKEIGRRARLEIEELLGARVYLDLWVRVKENWRNRPELLRTFGYGEFSG